MTATRTTAWIDRQALRANCKTLRKKAGGRGLFPVVKADGYGHGMEAVVKATLSEADGYCVFLPGDGIGLRRLDAAKPVLVLGGFATVDELRSICAERLWVAVGSEEQVKAIVDSGLAPERVFFKVQTGMNRLGLPPSIIQAAVEAVRASCPQLALMHHYASAEVPDGTKKQAEVMQDLVEATGLPYSASNSAALLLGPPTAEEFVRSGIAVYGCTPATHSALPAAQLGLAPAMKLTSSVIAVQRVAAGGAVGYGGRWQAASDTTVAIVACGYADGYPRIVADGAPVAIAGRVLPLAGRVSMEMLAVEVSDGEVSIGDEAQLWGDLVAVDEIAELAGTIGYELLTGVAERIPRRAV